jgi:hypothetical protein
MTGPLAALRVATAAAHASMPLDVAAAVLTIVIAAAIIRRVQRHHRRRLIRQRMHRLGSSNSGANGRKQP